MRKLHIMAITAIVVAAGMTGCGTTKAATLTTPPPRWVVTPPEDTAQTAFFVGYSSDDRGDIATAEENATYALISEITRYIGVTVSTETTAEARASLDSFATDLKQVVRQSGNARMSGFRIADKWINEENGRITVYILGEYEQKSLAAEKDRISALFKEKDEAVSRPEAEGKRLELAGDYFGSLKRYIEAAAAAAKSGEENAGIKFERNLNSVKEIISRFSLVTVKDNLENPVGVPFTDSLQIRLFYGEGANAVPVPGAAFQVSYREYRNGRTSIKAVNVLSDEKGRVVFTPPLPNAVGAERVSFYLDLAAYMEPLSDLKGNLKAQLSSVEDLVLTKRAYLSYSTFSRAKDVPTGIVILDVDKALNPIGTSETASGVFQSFTKAGFKVSTLSFDAALLNGMNDNQIVELMAKTFGGTVERVVFGVIGIEDFSQDNDQYVVRVSGKR